MIEIRVINKLTSAWVVEYRNIKYLLSNEDIAFINSKAYTYPNKLLRRYNVR